VVRVTETAFGPDEIVSSHEHANAYVSFLLAGAYAERTPTAERACLMGTVIWHPAGEIHSDHFCKQGGHLLNLEFNEDWLRSIRTDVQVKEAPFFSCGGPSYSVGLEVFRFLNSGGAVPEDLATELVGFYAFDSENPKQPEWFTRVLESIHDKHGQNLTLAAAAKIAGVHPVHVSRSFRRLLDCTFGNYVAQVRLRRAFDLLRSSTTALVDVALECGFADHAHLSRCFKRTTGITPSAYRSYLGVKPVQA